MAVQHFEVTLETTTRRKVVVSCEPPEIYTRAREILADAREHAPEGTQVREVGIDQIRVMR